MLTNLPHRLRRLQLEILEGDVEDDTDVDERLQRRPHFPLKPEVGAVLGIAGLVDVQAEVVGEGVVVEVVFQSANVVVKGHYHVLGISVMKHGR